MEAEFAGPDLQTLEGELKIHFPSENEWGRDGIFECAVKDVPLEWNAINVREGPIGTAVKLGVFVKFLEACVDVAPHACMMTDGKLWVHPIAPLVVARTHIRQDVCCMKHR